jgi:hypothetical protein
MKKCSKCNLEKADDCFYKHSHSNCCRSCFNEIIYARQKTNRLKAIEYLGGKCSRCGYSKCVGALEFHHIDKTKKAETYRRFKGWSWPRIVQELQNCILLCANCHREEEEKQFLCC